MRQLEIEMAHQKVKYNTQITEGEARMKQLQKTHEREVHYVAYTCEIDHVRPKAWSFIMS